MTCSSDADGSPWNGRQADLTWKALGLPCADTGHPAGANVCRFQGGGSAKSELIGVPSNWYAKDFDDSAWDTGNNGMGFGIGGVPTVAYNDCHRSSGDFTAANVTEWTIHDNDQSNNFGKLKDFATGSDVGMPSVTFTMGSEVETGSSTGE